MLNLINNLLGHIIDNLDSLLIILANNLEIVKYNKIAKKYFSLNCSASNPDLLNECCKIIHISKDELKLCLESNKQIHKLITLNHKLILELIIKRIFFNNVSYLIIQGFNVTENVLSRNHVKDLYSYLETIVDTVPHTIFWKDRNSTFMGCNKLFAKLAGLRFTNEIIGKTDFDLPWNKEQSQQYRALDKEVIESGQPKLNIEELQTLPNGVNITLLTSKVPLFDCHGNVTGVLGVYTDITERKKLEENLKLAKERAEQGNQAKNEFLENMRHDIRTPLTGIIGCAQLVQSQSNKPEKVAEYASDLIASSNALLDFLNKVLETIEVSTGKMPLLKKKFDLYQVLKSVIHLNKAQATAKNLELYLDYDKKLPAYMIGDPMRVQRIILELIVNALKFTNKGKVSVNASLIRETEKIIVKLAVSDTGIGISEENYQNIYTRFKRLVPSYQGVYPGTGLGLSVVKQFIEDLDAEIYLESQLQQGSTFTCLIPFQRPLLMDEDGLDEEITYSFEKILSFQAHKEDVITDKPANKMLSIGTRVLVVEDQIIAAKIAQRILLELHCQVDIASNKKKALDYIKKNRYDLILMDVGLQDEDGEEVTRCIRKDLSIFTPIIGLTAHVGTEKKHSCLVAGMDAIFVKPFTFEKASKILNAFIPGKRQNFLTQAVKDNIKETELLTILDIDRAIQLMGNKDFVKENLSLLVKNLSENLETLQQCYQNKDWQAIKGIAHKWMGGAIYCGARRLEKACQKFSISLQRETEQIEKFYQQLLQAAKATKELVINILSSQII